MATMLETTRESIVARAKAARELAGDDSPEALQNLIERAIRKWGNEDLASEASAEYYVLTTLPANEEELLEQEMLCNIPDRAKDHAWRTAWIESPKPARDDEFSDGLEVVLGALFALAGYDIDDNPPHFYRDHLLKEIQDRVLGDQPTQS